MSETVIKALSAMRIWISDDAHLGESEISRELEKAEGLRKLDAIEEAIAATLGSERIAELEAENERLRKAGYEIGYHDAMRAAKRGGTLTAEQVREAWCSNLKRDCLYDPPTPDWQAIADELNAALGGGECEWTLEHSGTLYDKWKCSACGYLYVESRTDGGATDLDPNYCPNCGRKAVER